MPAEDSSPANVQALLEENLRLSRAIYASIEKTRRYIFWNQVFGFLQLLIIVVPLVVGFLYLKPLLQQALSTYTQLLGSPSGAGSTSTLLNELKGFTNSAKFSP